MIKNKKDGKVMEKELWGVIYNAIPYNVDGLVLSDFVREEIANQIINELIKIIKK